MTLLAIKEFGLRAVSPISSERMERSITWVHSSDLLDPTPWLEPGQLLLTDGGQFTEHVAQSIADAYCERLRALDVTGLGFATDVIHAHIPDELVRACLRYDMPLLEVAGTTPFIGIIRHVASVEAADRSARLSWSLEAQRAVARAAVRDDGLREILRTLSQRLQTWVALYDAAGERVRIPGLRDVPGLLGGLIDDEARMLLEKGVPASLRTLTEPSATLQTIGPRRRLHGVLGVGADTPLGAAENDLVGSVIALASIALEQQRAVDESRRRIRTGILELLSAGQTREANRAAKAVSGPLPDAPVLVGAFGPVRSQSVLDELELLAASSGKRLFFAERSGNVLILVDAAAFGILAPLVARHGLRLGLSTAVQWPETRRGIDEALYAASMAAPGELSQYAEIASRGVIGALRSGGGALLAGHVRSRLAQLPDAEQRRLWSAARAWLDANTAWDPAARALGIHRHTLRARIDQLGELLKIDLTTFAGRAELWAAMEFIDIDADSPDDKH